MYTWGIKDFHKCRLGSLAKRILCLGPAGVINFNQLKKKKKKKILNFENKYLLSTY